MDDAHAARAGRARRARCGKRALTSIARSTDAGSASSMRGLITPIALTTQPRPRGVEQRADVVAAGVEARRGRRRDGVRAASRASMRAEHPAGAEDEDARHVSAARRAAGDQRRDERRAASSIASCTSRSATATATATPSGSTTLSTAATPALARADPAGQHERERRRDVADGGRGEHDAGSRRARPGAAPCDQRVQAGAGEDPARGSRARPCRASAGTRQRARQRLRLPMRLQRDVGERPEDPRVQADQRATSGITSTR